MAIQHRRGTAAEATTANVVLAAGQLGVETDTGRIKVGDGVTAWNSLPTGLRDAVNPDPYKANQTCPRLIVTTTTGVAQSTLFASTFIATKSETVTKIGMFTGATASVGATLAKMGLYSIAADGEATLLAGTANDTTMWTTANTLYERALSAVSVVEGSRYALATLTVGASTSHTLAAPVGPRSALAHLSPYLSLYLTSITDLPATVSAATANAATATTFFAWGYVSA